MKNYIVVVYFEDSENIVLTLQAKDWKELESRMRDYLLKCERRVRGYEYDEARFSKEMDVVCGAWVGRDFAINEGRMKKIEQEELLLQKLPIETARNYLAENLASAICFALKDKRKELGMSQKEISKLSGIPRSVISRIEGFYNSPSLNTVGKYLYALGYKIEDVYRIALFIKNLKKEK